MKRLDVRGLLGNRTVQIMAGILVLAIAAVGLISLVLSFFLDSSIWMGVAGLCAVLALGLTFIFPMWPAVVQEVKNLFKK